MTIEQVREFCYNLMEKQNIYFDCPIVESNRLSNTLGHCKYDISTYEIDKITFSSKLLKYGKKEQIIDTIIHEMAHAFVFLETHESQGHNSIWQSKMIELGGNPSATVDIDTVYKEEIQPEQLHKYTIYCQKCGQLVCTKERKCKVVSNPEKFTTNCCKAKIRVQQNW